MSGLESVISTTPTAAQQVEIGEMSLDMKTSLGEGEKENKKLWMDSNIEETFKIAQLHYSYHYKQYSPGCFLTPQ